MKAKKILLTISSLGLLVPSITIPAACLTSCSSPQIIKVQSIEISAPQTTLEVGKQINLSATVLPANATNKNIEWISDNTSIAKIDTGGRISPKSAGTCTITAKSEDGSNVISNSLKITVKAHEYKVEEIYLSTEIKGYVNETQTLTPEIYPECATNKKLEWSVEDPTVATLESTTGETNKITFNKNNSSTRITLTATDGSGITKSFPVTVNNNYIIKNKEIKNGAKITSSSFDQSTLKADSEIDVSYTTSASDEFIDRDSISVKYNNTSLTENVDYFISSHENKIKIPNLKDKWTEEAKLEINLVAKQIEDTTVSETAEQYIADRTFSVYIKNAVPSGKNYIGTCWILSDSTPDDSTDYKYYVATCRHIRELHGSASTLMLASASSSSQELVYSDFKQVSNSNIAWEPYENFVYQRFLPSINTGIDFFVGNFNLSEITSSNVYKTKLDKLNQLTAANKPITKIAPAASEYSNYEKLDMYQVGYPDNQYKYSCFLNNTDEIELIEKAGGIETFNHVAQAYSIKPQDRSKTMLGGASGSMLISKIENQWQVVGIQQGADLDDASYAHFDIFNFCTGDWASDFVSKYITIE